MRAESPSNAPAWMLDIALLSRRLGVAEGGGEKMSMNQRAVIRRASEEGRGADQCARADSVGRGTEGGDKGGGGGGREEGERSSMA